MSTASVRWFAAFLTSDSNAQDRARRYAEMLGFETYTPTLTRIQKRPDRRPGVVKTGRGLTYRKDVVSLPLWPRYRFVALPAENTPFGRLTNREALAHGLRGFVSVAGTPLEIPAREIDALRQREADGEFDGTVQRGRKREMRLDLRFDVGREATINAGPFRDFLARICGHLPDGRIQAEVNVFGRATPIELNVEHLA